MKETELNIRNAGIIGVGLIGGSYGLALKRISDSIRVLGTDQSQAHLKKAVELGLVDDPIAHEDWDELDLVLLCVPVDVLPTLLPEVLDRVGDNCLVVDAGSTKTGACMAVKGHRKRRNYLSCHPIAGTEYSGPEAAVAHLFRGRTQIICEVERTAFNLQELGLELFRRMGMRIRYMNPEAHDKHIAYVSHLSHISSFMLGKTVMEEEANERDIFDMAGSGFESTVRLAKSSPDMWVPIFRQNKEQVLETLDRYITNLEQFRRWMEEDDFDSVHQTMKEINQIRQILEGIPLTKTID